MSTTSNPSMNIDTYMEVCVKNALNFIKTEQKMIDYVKNFNEPNGFAFTSHSIIEKISDATDSDGHSGASFSICLRICQKKLIAEYEQEEEYKYHNHSIS